MFLRCRPDRDYGVRKQHHQGDRRRGWFDYGHRFAEYLDDANKRDSNDANGRNSNDDAIGDSHKRVHLDDRRNVWLSMWLRPRLRVLRG